MKNNRNSILELTNRGAVWLLASSSFACLLGHFYGFWSMRIFAWCVLIPSALLLGLIAYTSRHQANDLQNPKTWIIEGAIGGVLAAIVYDLFRLPFVIGGFPLFAVFPKFGQMLIYGTMNDDMRAFTQATGWVYHFANGASLGIMFLAMAPRATWRWLFWGAVVWSVAVEILLLLTPYYTFFKLKLPFNLFLALTLSAHLVFGVALGLWSWNRLRQLKPSIT